ncbi:MAG: OsmC family protein [Gammaproteobacteria bacterium]|nr:MAG: OsmC family protein [Gammaproteobacteria bacterium]
MKATVEWTGEAGFKAVADSGHAIQMDGPPDHGGRNQGARPMELVLMGMGGCASFDVVHILRKSRQDVTGCRAEIEAERAQTEPRVFTRIHLHFILSGNKLDPAKVERAVVLSAEKYCSASIMLGKTANITHDFEMLPSA